AQRLRETVDLEAEIAVGRRAFVDPREEVVDPAEARLVLVTVVRRRRLERVVLRRPLALRRVLFDLRLLLELGVLLDVGLCGLVRRRRAPDLLRGRRLGGRLGLGLVRLRGIDVRPDLLHLRNLLRLVTQL